jgi:hypothetical protein
LLGFQNGNPVPGLVLFKIAFVPVKADDFPQIEHGKNVYAGDGNGK